MPVMVDQRPLAIEELGFSTVGQVLCHLHRGRRLIVHLLIDGQEPDLDRIGEVRRAPLNGHTLYIETADPQQLARETVADVLEQIREAERLRIGAAELLQRDDAPAAMEKLRGCLTLWQHGQEAVGKVAQLLRVDLASLNAADCSVQAFLEQFAGQLRQIKSALEERDFVTLSDVLLYEMEQTGSRWERALEALGGSAG